MKTSVGIVGCGFIGGALKKWIEEHNPEINLLISDPYKGYNDDLSNSDIVFVSIHIPTEEDGTQDLTLLKEIICKLPDKPIFIRTTILPGTSERLSKECNRKVHFMPEFLTERTAYQDFCSQPMIFTAEIELLKKISKPEDVIIVAGKGHEDYQILADRTIHFDDREEVQKVFASLNTVK